MLEGEPNNLNTYKQRIRFQFKNIPQRHKSVQDLTIHPLHCKFNQNQSIKIQRSRAVRKRLRAFTLHIKDLQMKYKQMDKKCEDIIRSMDKLGNRMLEKSH